MDRYNLYLVCQFYIAPSFICFHVHFQQIFESLFLCLLSYNIYPGYESVLKYANTFWVAHILILDKTNSVAAPSKKKDPQEASYNSFNIDIFEKWNRNPYFVNTCEKPLIEYKHLDLCSKCQGDWKGGMFKKRGVS